MLTRVSAPLGIVLTLAGLVLGIFREDVTMWWLGGKGGAFGSLFTEGVNHIDNTRTGFTVLAVGLVAIGGGMLAMAAMGGKAKT